MKLTHLGENDRPKMADVSDKRDTTRIAVVSGKTAIKQEAYDMAKAIDTPMVIYDVQLERKSSGKSGDLTR